MDWARADSLERYLTLRLGILCLVMTITMSATVYLFFDSVSAASFAGLTAVLISLVLIAQIKNTVLSGFKRATIQLDAIGEDNYSQLVKVQFGQGMVNQFHSQLKALSIQLQTQKSRYDQHVFLVYQLISQLGIPVLVFNNKQQLSYANDASFQLFNQPWQSLKFSTTKALGLSRETKDNDWQFGHADKRWKIRSSQFIENGETQELLIFIDIQAELKQQQMQAWQQIVKVMSHEIRNSLAPVSSLAQSLSTTATSERQQTALEMIIERCQHLQHFVENYASLSKGVQIKPSTFDARHFFATLIDLYPAIQITLDCQAAQITADQTLLQQVFINLIKNAIEAGADKIQLEYRYVNQQQQFDIRDNGSGILNTDNLFVPLYTTKASGQGIGLSFCKNIVEQQGGKIELSNNSGPGVTASLSLPG
ncbi:sensor histidine kinase [Neptunicella sp. SCSIO 80796]|uniref:sensor histidine kinase n=1 Tax=Neptunicella plasticusilytica TaxID=3117012 RepID=UPI003A4E6666